jgi:hypothetical protein
MKDYKFIDQLLHRSALGIPWIAEMAFDFEKLLISPEIKKPQAFYVTGLARSGTTMLMRALYSTECFASLTYNDMPFVLSPNIWGRLTARYTKNKIFQERAHGDGIKVSYDSPEAFEEVFWKLYCEDDYINQDVLKVHSVNKKVLYELYKYHELVCHKYSKVKYLAKNNNFMLRMASVSKQDPSITFLVMYRNPIDQAMSLLNQHKRFDNSNNFTKDYMNWLSHHEFGDTHKPFQFGSNIYYGSLHEIDYWLQRWIDAYSFLLNLIKNNQSNIIPISYETLCGDPSCWENLCKKLSLSKVEVPFKLNTKVIDSHASDSLLKEALSLYNKLNSFSKKIL